MFEKMAQIENKAERAELFTSTHFLLRTLGVASEFLALICFVVGGAWLLGSELVSQLGLELGSGLTILAMVLSAIVLRLPWQLGQIKLEMAFGLEPRPFKIAAGRKLFLNLRRGLIVWLFLFLLYWILVSSDLFWWAISGAFLGFIVCAIDSWQPRWWRPVTLRPLASEELSADFLEKLARWQPKILLPSEKIMVSTTFSPFLELPRLEGLGNKRLLVIPERALASFTPQEMEVLVTSSLISSILKLPQKLMFLRFCVVAISFPIAAILISSIGHFWWKYPLFLNPALASLIALSLWFGAYLVTLSQNFLMRTLATQLGAAAGILLDDQKSLASALSTLADKNLEPENIPAWQELFRPLFSRVRFLKKVHQQEHLAKMPK